MLPNSIEGHRLWEALFALGVIAIAVFASQLVVIIFDRVLKVLTRRTRTTLDDLMVGALRRPIFLLVLVQGFVIAFTALTFLDRYQTTINQAGLIVSLAVVIYGVQRAVSALVTWYGQEFASKTASQFDDRLLPILRRILTAIIYAVGLLMILSHLGISISPILASLGIGGLAVALALQPTLTNFIAGGYLVSEGGIGVGNFVQIENGPAGVIQDVGWRTTKVRTLSNNLVILPNSKMADSIITNYSAPTPDMGVSVACGVSYESNLEQVRRIALEVAIQLINETPGAIKDVQPAVLFYEFGDSNINFRVSIRVEDFTAQYLVIDTLIARLHARFTKEGIEISYPVRKLVYPAGIPRRGQPALEGTQPGSQ